MGAKGAETNYYENQIPAVTRFEQDQTSFPWKEIVSDLGWLLSVSWINTMSKISNRESAGNSFT
jgi:hypothetical protein